MKKYRFDLDLQLFSEDPGVDEIPAAEGIEEIDASEPGAEQEVAAEPEKQNNYEKAFAKRLAAEREKWQSETAEKYKDYDLHKELSSWAQARTGADALTLKEQIEMERLQERADENEISPEMQRRLETLEAKAAKADELEEKQTEEQRTKGYFDSLGKFMEGKASSAEELNKYMIENSLTYDPNNVEKSLNIAYKAMRADQLEEELKTSKETAVKEYLKSKGAPRVEGSGTPGIAAVDTSKMEWKDIRQVTLARLNAANQPS